MTSARAFAFAAPVVLASLLVWGCASSPTGRKQLMLLPESQLNGMGAQSFDQMKKETPIESDSRVNAYVKCVTAPITRAEGGASGVSNWEVVVFKDSSANAFALPGGKIGVHTGMLSVAKTPDQLAAVIGHEVGHVIAKHGNERVSQGLLAQGLTSVAGIAVKDPRYQSIVMAGLGVGAQYGFLLPHSRTQESEADLIGLDLMARAGFDPRESVSLWKNMSAAGGKAPSEWMSTHPSHETRIKNLEANIPAAMPKYQASAKTVNCVKP